MKKLLFIFNVIAFFAFAIALAREAGMDMAVCVFGMIVCWHGATK